MQNKNFQKSSRMSARLYSQTNDPNQMSQKQRFNEVFLVNAFQNRHQSLFTRISKKQKVGIQPLPSLPQIVDRFSFGQVIPGNLNQKENSTGRFQSIPIDLQNRQNESQFIRQTLELPQNPFLDKYVDQNRINQKNEQNQIPLKFNQKSKQKENNQENAILNKFHEFNQQKKLKVAEFGGKDNSTQELIQIIDQQSTKSLSLLKQELLAQQEKQQLENEICIKETIKQKIGQDFFQFKENLSKELKQVIDAKTYETIQTLIKNYKQKQQDQIQQRNDKIQKKASQQNKKESEFQNIELILSPIKKKCLQYQSENQKENKQDYRILKKQTVTDDVINIQNDDKNLFVKSFFQKSHDNQNKQISQKIKQIQNQKEPISSNIFKIAQSLKDDQNNILLMKYQSSNENKEEQVNSDHNQFITQQNQDNNKKGESENILERENKQPLKKNLFIFPSDRDIYDNQNKLDNQNQIVHDKLNVNKEQQASENPFINKKEQNTKIKVDQLIDQNKLDYFNNNKESQINLNGEKNLFQQKQSSKENLIWNFNDQNSQNHQEVKILNLFTQNQNDGRILKLVNLEFKQMKEIDLNQEINKQGINQIQKFDNIDSWDQCKNYNLFSSNNNQKNDILDIKLNQNKKQNIQSKDQSNKQVIVLQNDLNIQQGFQNNQRKNQQSQQDSIVDKDNPRK